MMRLGAMTIGLLLAGGLAAQTTGGTAMERALADGATRMTSDAIAERLAGKTVTFENATSGKRALVYYDGENGTELRLLDTGDTFEGFYATTLDDRICVGAWSDEPMRVRCVYVLLIDNIMHKYEMDGSLRGRVIEEVDGNTV